MSDGLGYIPYPIQQNRWEDDPNTPWVTPQQPQTASVNVSANGTRSPFTNYVQDRVGDRLRAQGYDVQPSQPAAAPVNTGGMPVVPIGADGKPLTGRDTGPATPPGWIAMLGGQQQKTPQPPGSRSLGMVVYDNSGVIGLNTAQGYVPLPNAASTAPAASPVTPVAPTAAAAPAAPPAGNWFMPNMVAGHQGGSIYTDPTTGKQMPWLDTSPPPLPYEQWQQPPAPDSAQAAPPTSYGSFLARYWGGQPSVMAQRDFQQYQAFMQRHPSDPELQQWLQTHAAEEAHVRTLRDRESMLG